MTHSDEKDLLEQDDIMEEMEDELEEIENEEWDIDEEAIEEAQHPHEEPVTAEDKLKAQLARTMADYENFKKRVERDKQDMIFFLKSDIFKTILPRMDDLERILTHTPEDQKSDPLYEWLVSLETKFKKDLEKMHVKPFESKWNPVDPEMHDVMTTIPGKKEWIICDEFEKWYMLGDKVLRHAKVVVGTWE